MLEFNKKGVQETLSLLSLLSLLLHSGYTKEKKGKTMSFAPSPSHEHKYLAVV